MTMGITVTMQSTGEQNMQRKCLSLGLGTQLSSTASVPPFQYQYHDTGGLMSLMSACLPNLKNGTTTTSSKDDDDEANLHNELTSTAAECMASISSGGFHDITKREGFFNPHPSSYCESPGFSNIVLNSQYLKAAQDLLDEAVNVRKALNQPGMEKQEKFSDFGLLDNSKDTTDGKSTGQSMQISSGPNNGSNSRPSCEELSPVERQNLLDKKTKLLSMLDEIKDTDNTLRYVDQQLRQQKALQQLGVMRQAWRPQRGLPESSVSILRAWLFEHFLRPYPKDSEKIMLARQTGLTRNQVANWFINARVRLWKPMVEEIYKEEFDDSDMNRNLLYENTLKGIRDGVQELDNKSEESQDNVITGDSTVQPGQFHHGLKSEQASSTTELDRVDREENVMMDYGTRKLQSFSMNNGDGLTKMASSTPATYDLSELGNFTVGGHVSLALELRNPESDEFAMSDYANHKSRNQTLASSSETDLLDYHFTYSGKQQHRFGKFVL